MKTTIEVKDRKEGDAIRGALDDPTTRSLVIVLGVLGALPDKRNQKRVLDFVTDYFEQYPGA